MGSTLKFNDTLKISVEKGFPCGLTLEKHLASPSSSAEFVGREFEFWNPGERHYHNGERVFLVEEMKDGKWLHWGNALITSQTIENGKTSGRYKIIKIYSPDFQKRMTIEESPAGKSFFDEKPTSYLGN